ncbi:MAG: SPOR domain-containing protein [Erythrobacter sp.]
MDRIFTSRTNSPTRRQWASPLLALVIPAALAGITLASDDAAAAPPGADVAFAKAKAALEKGEAAKAVGFAEAAVAGDPLNADYRAMLGAAYMGAGRFMAAATSFEDALDLGHDDARTVLSYALAKTAIGDARVAVAALDEAQGRLDPSDYGLALAMAGQAERGVQVLIAAVRSGQTSIKLRQNLAYSFALSGNWSAARVMAAEDVPAGELAQRMAQWAANAAPEQAPQRVAALLRVPLSDDLGQPAHLALNNFLNDAPMMAAGTSERTPERIEAPAFTSVPERISQSEALAFGIAEPATAAPMERIDPTPQAAPVANPAPVRLAVAPLAQAQASAQAPTTQTQRSTVQFISKPVIQQLPQATSRAAAAAPSNAAPAPAPQRRMAATAAASNTPSDQALSSHLVQLGSYNSKIEAERGWTVLKKQFPQLAAHDVVITEAVVNGRTFWRVAAAGFGPNSARSLCGTVKSAGRGCFAYAAANPPAGAVDKGVRMAARSR